MKVRSSLPWGFLPVAAYASVPGGSYLLELFVECELHLVSQATAVRDGGWKFENSLRALEATGDARPVERRILETGRKRSSSSPALMLPWHDGHHVRNKIV